MENEVSELVLDEGNNYYSDEYEDYEEDDNSVMDSEDVDSDEEEEELSENEDVVDGVDVEASEGASVFLSNVSNSIIRNKLTKYEYTRIFSSRVTHIQNGSIPMVNVDKDMTVEDIVKREFEQGRIPLILERTLPKEKGTLKEYRRVNEVFNTIMS